METEEGYRRGTVLGLTIAEIFILLVFLMLLALMGVNRYWGGKLGSWKPIITQHTPEEIQAALKHPDRGGKEVASLTRQIEELKKEKERLQERIRTLEDREGKAGELLDETQEKLRGVERSLVEGSKALAEATQEGSRLRDDNPDLQDEVASLGNQIRIFGKGITPPCWYQRIEETNLLTQASWREKPYYLFDIAIHEDHMEVQSLPIPDGSAEDDRGAPYTEEAEYLQLNKIPYGVPLTDTELRNVMRPLYERGKASEVRSYSCIFYVRVWDETPPGAKERWKQAHDGVLEQLFGTHQVRGTSWIAREEEPVNVRVQTVWQGLKIEPENRCSEFNRERDYPYSQSLEHRILERLGEVRCSYTGKTYDTLLETDIEHIVALSEAHDSGLCSADAEIRRQFSSDFLNLTLADPAANTQKSDRDPGEWLPEINRQWYAQRVIAVKRMYGLTVDRREQQALQSVLVDLTTAQPGTQDASGDAVGPE